MSEFGQHPAVEPMIADVQSVDVLELFLDSGDDLLGAWGSDPVYGFRSQPAIIQCILHLIRDHARAKTIHDRPPE